MSRPDFQKDLRESLVADSTVTSYVSSSDITMGWKKTDTSFPCIVISRADGKAIGRMGVGTSPSGDRMAEETVTFRIDIASRTSQKNLEQISDAIFKVLTPLGYEKMGEVDMYDEDKETFIRTLTYNLLDVYSF